MDCVGIRAEDRDSRPVPEMPICARFADIATHRRQWSICLNTHVITFEVLEI